jgi:hypothetical protein
LSANAKKKQTESATTPDGRVFTREVNNLLFKHQARNYETMLSAGSLVDAGTNLGLAGGNTTSLALQTMLSRILVSVHLEQIIGLFAQCADHGVEKLVHLSSQMRDFGLDVNDFARR